GMEDKLQDDAAFLSDLQRNLDFANQAKLRNDRMTSRTRRRIWKTLLCGLVISSMTVIMTAVSRLSAISLFSVVYAVIPACLYSIAAVVYGLSDRS
ncbi:MAG: hypothetical protein ACI4TM_00525, partial [Candidatus Cryptobacteroides sp.]